MILADFSETVTQVSELSRVSLFQALNQDYSRAKSEQALVFIALKLSTCTKTIGGVNIKVGGACLISAAFLLANRIEYFFLNLLHKN